MKAPLTEGSDPGNVSRHMLVTAIGHFYVPIAALVSAPILAHALGVTGRGEVAAATAPLTLAVAIAAFGLPQSIIHHLARYPNTLRSLIGPALALQLVVSLVCVAILVSLSTVLAGGDPSLAHLIAQTSLALPATLAVGIVRALASGLHEWTLVTIERCVIETTKLVLFVVFALMNSLTVESAVWITVSASIASGLCYLPLLRLRASRAGMPREKISLAQVGGYGVRVWIGALSGILLTRLAQVIMTPLAGVNQLGLYVVAVNVSDAALLANNAVRDVTLASDSAAREDARATASARYSLIISIAVGILIVATMPLWFTFMFGESFAPAMTIVTVLVIANVAGVPGSVAGAILSARGRPGLRSTALVVAAVINVTLLFVLVPQFGAMGAAWAALVGNLVAANMNIVFAKVILKLRLRDFYLIRPADVKGLVNTIRRVLKR